jgi:hypothetical protein
VMAQVGDLANGRFRIRKRSLNFAEGRAPVGQFRPFTRQIRSAAA